MTANKKPTTDTRLTKENSQAVRDLIESHNRVIAAIDESIASPHPFITSDGEYEYEHYETDSRIVLSHIRDKSNGLLADILIQHPIGIDIKRYYSYNLYSNLTITKLANDISKRKNGIPWEQQLENAVNRTIDRYKEPPPLTDLSTPPQSQRLEYLLYPLLPLNHPTTLYSQGGKGKSVIADYISVIVSHGITPGCGLPFRVNKGNVLYLDWENESEDHKRYIHAIAKGLDITLNKDLISYISCPQPLNDYMPYIRRIVKERNIKLVIVDSQMAATATGNQGMSEAQISSEYYNNLKMLGCTTLTIDHVTKQHMNTSGLLDNAAPYGSVVKYNRSRCQFELKQIQETESNFIQVAFHHRKFNIGIRQKPFGMQIDFCENNPDTLDTIIFSGIDISGVEELGIKASNRDLIRKAIYDCGGSASVQQIVEYTALPDGSVRRELNNERSNFIRLNSDKRQGLWGIKSNEY